jgi:hypothetical protein
MLDHLHINSLLYTLGEWLLDTKLLNKRLDVRIQGTRVDPWQGGRYEGSCGFLVLEESPRHVTVAVVVKVGPNESRIRFPLRYIFPLMTTERPPTVLSNAAQPVISTLGERVVVIGSDYEGASDFIGCYGLIYTVGVSGFCYVNVGIPGQYYGQLRYFSENSLCRSTYGAIEWFNKTIY